jgi:Fe-S-cluster containining protein
VAKRIEARLVQSSPEGPIPAGRFSSWLTDTETSLARGTEGVAVPCGSCTACCRSSMFVHVRPEETETIRRIPAALLFAAPGWPKGHLLMGYDDRGRCPMLDAEDKCSIYDARPLTCRTYDCRVFAATGMAVDEQSQPDIAARARAWAFTYDGEDDHADHAAVRKAADFLRDQSHLFPGGSLPSQPARLAALAVRIYRLFQSHAAPAMSDTAIASAVLAILADSSKPTKVAPEILDPSGPSLT